MQREQNKSTKKYLVREKKHAIMTVNNVMTGN